MAQSQLEEHKIAYRYAKALIDASEEEGGLDASTFKQDLREMQQLFEDIPELEEFFRNPMIPEDEKTTLVNERFKSVLSPLVARFLDILIENGRIALVALIVKSAVELINRKEGIATAEVTVPVKITKTLERQLRSSLEDLFGYRQVNLDVRVDPAILAGAIVKIGDKMIDGSYRGKLETLRRQVG